MSSFVRYNANPAKRAVGDCVVRALSKALAQGWEETYVALCLQGYLMQDLPNANSVWGAYLRHRGYERHFLPDDCPDCYSVENFCADHRKGTYVLALSGHVVCVCDGCYYDTWDSGGEVPIYYWQRKDDV